MCGAAEQLLGWRVFPLPLTNVNSLALPAVVPAGQPAAAPGAPANSDAQAPVSAVASLSAPAAAPEHTSIIALGGRTELVRAIRSGEQSLFIWDAAAHERTLSKVLQISVDQLGALGLFTLRSIRSCEPNTCKLLQSAV